MGSSWESIATKVLDEREIECREAKAARGSIFHRITQQLIKSAGTVCGTMYEVARYGLSEMDDYDGMSVTVPSNGSSAEKRPFSKPSHEIIATLSRLGQLSNAGDEQPAQRGVYQDSTGESFYETQ